MITPDATRQKLVKHYYRWHRRWASALFCEACEIPLNNAESASCSYSILLQPPTEKEVLADGASALTWVTSWKTDRLAPFVEWEQRNWVSVGKQEIPQKLLLPDVKSIAKSIGQEKSWNRLKKRTLVLAQCLNEKWQASEEVRIPSDPLSLRKAIEKCVSHYQDLSESDWERLMATLDWLLENPETKCYIRQLPIRGIDSKWLETHKAAVEPFYCAITGRPSFGFAAIEAQIQTRFLDVDLSPGGMQNLSASPEELSHLEKKPQLVIVTENLTSLYCLPELPGTIALHGKGYAVDILSHTSWLSSVPVLYWGDLDSNGFAILDRLRHYHPEVVSLMMDKDTLDHHQDLCGVETSPKRGVYECLTTDEQEVLAILLAGEHATRLEQERIEWHYALGQIQQAVAKFIPSKTHRLQITV